MQRFAARLDGLVWSESLLDIDSPQFKQTAQDIEQAVSGNVMDNMSYSIHPEQNTQLLQLLSRTEDI